MAIRFESIQSVSTRLAVATKSTPPNLRGWRLLPCLYLGVRQGTWTTHGEHCREDNLNRELPPVVTARWDRLDNFERAHQIPPHDLRHRPNRFRRRVPRAIAIHYTPPGSVPLSRRPSNRATTYRITICTGCGRVQAVCPRPLSAATYGRSGVELDGWACGGHALGHGATVAAKSGGGHDDQRRGFRGMGLARLTRSPTMT